VPFLQTGGKKTKSLLHSSIGASHVETEDYYLDFEKVNLKEPNLAGRS